MIVYMLPASYRHTRGGDMALYIHDDVFSDSTTARKLRTEYRIARRTTRLPLVDARALAVGILAFHRFRVEPPVVAS